MSFATSLGSFVAIVAILFGTFPFSLLVTADASSVNAGAEDFLSRGDHFLAEGQNDQAIQYYQQGIEVFDEEESSLQTELSLHTNLGSAYSANGDDETASKCYENALTAYKRSIGDIVEKSVRKDCQAIAAQASFFLGMVYQDLSKAQDAADAYRYANTLDPLHWASMANLGAVLQDEMANHGAAMEAYNGAYQILTSMDPEKEPTDPPAEPRYILSQLQYRIGLCISHDLTRKCALTDNPDTVVDCREMAAHAFSLSLEYDPDNESAKHMLATVTADATMKRASNKFVKSLFDDYASNFEHSLVHELGYTGYERLRRGFDRAFSKGDGTSPSSPTFGKVVDAGCGTGLVGEQFRNISQHLIGVDLSEAIIEEAKKARPNLYDETVVGDITQVFRQRKPIDLIVAADSFIYFGDLEPLFASIAEGLGETNDAFVAFTLEDVDAASEEALAQTKPDWRWQLTPSGRFAHRKEYVLSVCQANDLELVHYEQLINFRFERGVGVRGHLFVMRRVAVGTTTDQEL